MNASNRYFAAALLACFIAAPAALFAAHNSAPTLVDDHRVAVQGYDVVAYFNQGQPSEGNALYRAQHDGAIYHFANTANRDAFLSAPERYTPQYGGYCAWGVGAKDDLFPVDPTVWRIVDGKLYLNNSVAVQRQWNADIAGFIQQADANWTARQAHDASH